MGLGHGPDHQTGIDLTPLKASMNAYRTEGFPGASGSDAGVKLVELDEYDPAPCSEIAATRKMYAVPFVKPRTVVAVVGEVPSTNVVHVAPLSALY